MKFDIQGLACKVRDNGYFILALLRNSVVLVKSERNQFYFNDYMTKITQGATVVEFKYGGLKRRAAH